MAEGAEQNGEPAGTERAEEILGQWGQRLGRFLAVTAARVREEPEDMLAEAQRIRRGERE